MAFNVAQTLIVNSASLEESALELFVPDRVRNNRSILYFMVINQILTNDICLAVSNWKVRYVGGNRISYSAEALTSLDRCEGSLLAVFMTINC